MSSIIGMKRLMTFAAMSLGSIAMLVPQAGFAAQHSVSALDNYFTPKNITVAQGDTVVWTNNGILQHTITADDSSVDSGTLRHGNTVALRFNTAGMFPYFCRFHGAPGGVGMAGTVTVTAASSSSGTAGATTTSTMMMNMPGMQQMMQQMMQQQTISATTSQCVRITENLSFGKRSIRARVNIALEDGDVVALQAFLRNQGFLPVNPTGFFGPLTLRAVQLFQREHGIPATGFVGPITRARIEAITCGVPSTGTGTTSAATTTLPATRAAFAFEVMMRKLWEDHIS